MNRTALWILLIVLCASIAGAANIYTVEFSLKDINTNAHVKELFLEVSVKSVNSGEETRYTYFIHDEDLRVGVGAGTYEVVIRGDDLKTNGKDYYYAERIVVDSNVRKNAFMLPVGSLIGTVEDVLDNLIENASLKFECEKDYAGINPISTDQFGSFTNKFIPIGACKITAVHGERVGAQKITISQGELSDINITLNREIVSFGNKEAFVNVFVLIVIIGGIGSFVYHRFHKGKEEQPMVKEKKESFKRANDVMNTLNERERKIVEFLLAHKYESPQAAMRHHTKIPKTSMVRILESLKRKKIVDVDEIGKFKKVKLTPWFLEKKE